MDIKNQGRGVHEREIPGLEKLRALLPREWYGFTNLELATGPGQSREIDLVMVIEDRVLLVDLKDWNGRITAEDGRWFHKGRDMGPSPVEKIRGNARKVAEILKAHLRDRAKASPRGPGSCCDRRTPLTPIPDGFQFAFRRLAVNFQPSNARGRRGGPRRWPQTGGGDRAMTAREPAATLPIIRHSRRSAPLPPAGRSLCWRSLPR
jgi:hypothetical protein